MSVTVWVRTDTGVLLVEEVDGVRYETTATSGAGLVCDVYDAEDNLIATFGRISHVMVTKASVADVGSGGTGVIPWNPVNPGGKG